MRVFGFIEAEKANFSIKFMCERLGVIRRGFYARRRAAPVLGVASPTRPAPRSSRRSTPTRGATMGRRGSALSSQTTTTSAAAANGSPG